MQAHRHEVARLQSDFYRDQYRKTLRKLVRLIIVMYLLVAAVAYVILTQKTNTYYANTSEGNIMSMPAPIQGGAGK